MNKVTNILHYITGIFQEWIHLTGGSPATDDTANIKLKASFLQQIFAAKMWKLSTHDDVIKWKHFPRYWPFVQGIHRSPVNSLHKGQWRGALMFSLICVWINVWVNNREAGDLRCHHVHYDVTVMNIYYPFNTSWSLTGLYNSGTPAIRYWLGRIKIQLLRGPGRYPRQIMQNLLCVWMSPKHSINLGWGYWNSVIGQISASIKLSARFVRWQAAWTIVK